MMRVSQLGACAWHVKDTTTGREYTVNAMLARPEVVNKRRQLLDLNGATARKVIAAVEQAGFTVYTLRRGKVVR